MIIEKKSNVILDRSHKFNEVLKKTFKTIEKTIYQ